MDTMEPTLVIMAAGMGSRFGWLKQMTPVDEAGQVILDYSAYDAVQVGFRHIVCIIKKELEGDFRRLVGDRIAAKCDLQYAFQALDDLPDGFAVPAGREKPWGTAHAVRAARKAISGPFAVINADDFYGRGAFQALYDFLSQNRQEHTHCLVAYKLRNTLTENGTVARGICTADQAGRLLTVTERTAIRGPADAPAYTEDGGSTWTVLDPDAPVSLNTWGFHPSFLDAIEDRMGDFLQNTVPQNPLKAEFFLPGVVNDRLCAGTDRVQMLYTDEVWHGVTYRDDLPALQKALTCMQQQGIYPKNLWR
jgi:hypothetical protein